MLCSWLLQCCSAFVFNGVGVTAAHCVSLLPGFRVQAIDVVNDVACFDPEGMALPSPQEQITTLGVKVLDADERQRTWFNRKPQPGWSGSGFLHKGLPYAITHRYNDEYHGVTALAECATKNQKQ